MNKNNNYFARVNSELKNNNAKKIFLVCMDSIDGNFCYTECDTLVDAKKCKKIYSNDNKYSNVYIDLYLRYE